MARLSFLSPFVELTNEENVEADRNILGRLERRGEVKIFHDLDLLAIVCDGGCHIDQYNDQCTLPLCHLASHTWIVNICSSSHLNCCLPISHSNQHLNANFLSLCLKLFNLLPISLCNIATIFTFLKIIRWVQQYYTIHLHMI